MGLIEHPQRKAYQLAWVRVILRLAASGPDDLKKSLLAWATRWQSQFLTGETGAIPASRLAEVPALARDLGLMQEGRITDAGQAIIFADTGTWETEGGNPFALDRRARWMLWWCAGSHSDEFWSAAFRTWVEGATPNQWLLAAAHSLAEDSKPSLLHLLEGMNPEKHHEMHGKPRFGQLQTLGWTGALPRLREWAQGAPHEWESEHVAQAFSVAEGLPLAEPSLDRLRRVTSSLPLELRGLFGDEAPAEVIQALAICDGLNSGAVEQWFGPAWEATLREAGKHGVVKKSGGDSASANLTWPKAAFDVAWEPAPPAAVVEQPVTPPPDPVPAAPVEPRDEEPLDPGLPPEPPPAGLFGLDESERRAASWLRAVAWWCRGPSVGDLLVRGHDSLLLVVGTLERWLAVRERKRWEARTGKYMVAGREVDPVAEAIRNVAHILQEPHLKWLSTEIHVQKADHLEAAVRKVSTDATGALGERILAWIADGTGDFESIELATSVWLGNIVDIGRASRQEIQIGVFEVTEKPVEGAVALVRRLSDGANVESTWRFEGRLVVVGDTLEFTEPLVQDGVQFSRVASEDAAAFRGQILSYSCTGTGTDVRATALRMPRIAAHSLRKWAVSNRRVVEIAYSAVDPPDAYTGADEPVLVGIQPQKPAEAGRGRWLLGDWASSPEPPVPGPGWREAEAREFWRSAIESHPAHRLVALWFAVEHGVAGGDAGGPVVEELARAAAAVLPQALYDDVSVALRLIAHPDPLPESWAGVAAWSPTFDCDWMKLRWSRLNGLFARGGERTVLDASWRAVGHAAWVLQAVYGMRNRVAHEADWGLDKEEQVLDRLHSVASRLVKALVDARTAGIERNWHDLALLATALPPKAKTNEEKAKEKSFDSVAYVSAWGSPLRRPPT